MQPAHGFATTTAKVCRTTKALATKAAKPEITGHCATKPAETARQEKVRC